MGDDFIGYKFVEGGSKFWNGVLSYMHENGEDLSMVDSAWLNELNIKYVEHDSETWNAE